MIESTKPKPNTLQHLKPLKYHLKPKESHFSEVKFAKTGLEFVKHVGGRHQCSAGRESGQVQ